MGVALQEDSKTALRGEAPILGRASGGAIRRKTVVLTGASRGIGHSTVKCFARAGWRVISCSRHPVPKQCLRSQEISQHFVIDLSDAEKLTEGLVELRQALAGEPIDALVNNAGFSPKQAAGERLNTLQTSLDTWRQVLQVNLLAPVMLASALLPELARAHGVIVNVTSIAGSRVHPFAGAAYATSKAALSKLTREMAADFGPMGVRVNAIAPGEINTTMLSPGTESLVETIPMQRLGTTQEVADIIYFLCSRQARYINGAELPVNGGQHV